MEINELININDVALELQDLLETVKSLTLISNIQFNVSPATQGATQFSITPMTKSGEFERPFQMNQMLVESMRKTIEELFPLIIKNTLEKVQIQTKKVALEFLKNSKKEIEKIEKAVKEFK